MGQRRLGKMEIGIDGVVTHREDEFNDESRISHLHRGASFDNLEDVISV